jgi:hypothetical protein
LRVEDSGDGGNHGLPFGAILGKLTATGGGNAVEFRALILFGLAPF